MNGAALVSGGPSVADGEVDTAGADDVGAATLADDEQAAGSDRDDRDDEDQRAKCMLQGQFHSPECIASRSCGAPSATRRRLRRYRLDPFDLLRPTRAS